MSITPPPPEVWAALDKAAGQRVDVVLDVNADAHTICGFNRTPIEDVREPLNALPGVIHAAQDGDNHIVVVRVSPNIDPHELAAIAGAISQLLSHSQINYQLIDEALQGIVTATAAAEALPPAKPTPRVSKSNRLTGRLICRRQDNGQIIRVRIEPGQDGRASYAYSETLGRGPSVRRRLTYLPTPFQAFDLPDNATEIARKIHDWAQSCQQ
jgi:hypothetical protein